eukprot:14832566-Ditylum_brightwellii.AAC.1
MVSQLPCAGATLEQHVAVHHEGCTSRAMYRPCCAALMVRKTYFGFEANFTRNFCVGVGVLQITFVNPSLLSIT